MDPQATNSGYAAPVSQSERIIILDSLRGFAILGILLMNIPSFSLPGPVGHDPSILQEQGASYFSWYFINLFPDGTQRAIFSMLFGAGVVLFTSRLENKMNGTLPLDYFIRRQLWLIVFSLFDVFILLWNGDILLDYALMGMVIVVFRKLSSTSILYVAAGCFILMLARENRDLYESKRMIQKGEIVAAIDTSKTKLTILQHEDLGAMMDFKERFTQEKKIKRMNAAMEKIQGSYENIYDYRTSRYINDIVGYTYFAPWDVLVFMFIGMAFFKMGILTGQAPIKVYWVMFIGGTGLGLLFSYLHLQPIINYKFNWFDYTKNIKVEYYELTRILRTFSIFGLLMLLYKSNWFKWLFALMRPTGQMAFTNYLMQSLMCGFFFNGWGLGMYGKLQRHEIYYVVGVIWIIQIVYSNIWLRYFRFGPLEWCWRSLTYWKKQPMKKLTVVQA